MSVSAKFAPVGAGQKVAENQKEAESKRPITVSWNRTSATIGQVVGITGVVNIVVKNPSLLTVEILFNGKTFAAAENVELKNTSLTAHWKVKAYKAGNFTEGAYDVEVRYNGGVSGKTSAPLKIASVVKGGDSFG